MRTLREWIKNYTPSYRALEPDVFYLNPNHFLLYTLQPDYETYEWRVTPTVSFWKNGIMRWEEEIMDIPTYGQHQHDLMVQRILAQIAKSMGREQYDDYTEYDWKGQP